MGKAIKLKVAYFKQKGTQEAPTIPEEKIHERKSSQLLRALRLFWLPGNGNGTRANDRNRNNSLIYEENGRDAWRLFSPKRISSTLSANERSLPPSSASASSNTSSELPSAASSPHDDDDLVEFPTRPLRTRRFHLRESRHDNGVNFKRSDRHGQRQHNRHGD